MYFADRYDAGRQLAEKLTHYKDQDTIILALPRGGVPVAVEIGRVLHKPVSILVSRKLGAPGEEELAIGAIAEFGGEYMNEELVASLGITPHYIEEVKQKELKEMSRRITAYRGTIVFPELSGKTVILVDDGIATGATMLAAIDAMKKQQAGKVIVVIPVIANSTVYSLAKVVDEVIYVHAPMVFLGVGQFYKEFEQVTDGEVMEILHKNTV